MKNKSAYSLVEVLVTMVIFAVLLTMMVQVLILSMNSSRKIAVRSKIRSDISDVSVMMRRDFRNATFIDNNQCGSPTNPNFGYSKGCLFTLAGRNYAWVFGEDTNQCREGYLCKLREEAGEYKLYYESSDFIKFYSDSSMFELDVFENTGDETQGLLLVTMKVEPTDSSLEVPAQIRQVNVFSRNF